MRTMKSIDPRLAAIKSSLYRVSLKAVVVRDGKLLVTREVAGWYNLPGGGLDYGEEVEAALLRELHEELGLSAQDVTISPKIVAMSHEGMLDGIPWVNVYYQTTLHNPESIKEAELQFKWVTAAQLKTLELSPAIQHDRSFLLSQVQLWINLCAG
jgi:8-oxo-dGTP diphosphatase